MVEDGRTVGLHVGYVCSIVKEKNNFKELILYMNHFYKNNFILYSCYNNF